MSQPKISNMALCPQCDGLIQLNGKLRIGQRLTCRRCETPLAIIAIKPLGLAVANATNTIKNGSKTKKKKTMGKGINFAGPQMLKSK